MDDGVRARGFDHLRVDLTPPQLPIRASTPMEATLRPGFAIVGGRPVWVYAPINYSAQRWINPHRAAADGVDPIPQLPLVQAGTSGVIFLDVWEREVDSREDRDLVNDQIGVETCVRMKREVAIRWHRSEVPTAPAGHRYMPLVQFAYAATPTVFVLQRTDTRPVQRLRFGEGDLSFLPAFQPVGSSSRPAWYLADHGEGRPYICGEASGAAEGVLQLALPEEIRILRLNIAGQLQVDGRLRVILVRNGRRFGHSEALMAETIRGEGGGDEEMVDFSESLVPDQDAESVVVDNAENSYLLWVSNRSRSARITHIGIHYAY